LFISFISSLATIVLFELYKCLRETRLSKISYKEPKVIRNRRSKGNPPYKLGFLSSTRIMIFYRSKYFTLEILPICPRCILTALLRSNLPS
jgi:hypothetical protein